MHVLERAQFDTLLEALQQHGRQVIGPVRRDGVIGYEPVRSAGDLPVGWADEQEAGRYRLHHKDHGRLFDYTAGFHTWKRYLYPPTAVLWQASRDNGRLSFETPSETPPKFALLGVRACELHAIAIQDKVFLDGAHPDPAYAVRRNNAFIIAVNCGRAGGTCFCASMETGPRAQGGYDLALTEVAEDGRHYFTVEAGTKKGERLLDELELREAIEAERAAAAAAVEAAANQMGRQMPVDGLRELLAANPESPRWEAVAKRCLCCANCTMACPTCFCSTVHDSAAMTGEIAKRERVWDSCFTMEFSYVHGGSVRKDASSRYRQWMTHKLSSWHDQFGSSGCVGCGRCITWCPVGIDITEEAWLLQEAHGGPTRTGE